MDYVTGSFVVDYGPRLDGMTPTDPGWFTPTVEVIPNFNGTGRTLVRATWPPSVNQTANFVATALQIRIKGQIQSGAPAGNHTNSMGIFDSVHTMVPAETGRVCRLPEAVDINDLNSNGNTTEIMCVSSAPYTVVSAAAVNVVKTVKGSLDPAFVGSPGIGRTVPGSASEYNIAVQNAGNVPLQDVISYDVLPYIGDTGTSGSQVASPRLSAWQADLAAPIVAPAGTTVQYSQSTNPCRGEVFAAGGLRASAPAGCTDDWSAIVPAPLSSVRALRFVVTGPMAPAATTLFNMKIASPASATGVAWNTVAVAAQRVDDSTFLLPSETSKVGLEAAVVSVNKTVASAPVDNGDGTQSVTYNIDVTNTGNTGITYDLSDPVRFGTGITVVSSTVSNTAPGGIVTNPGWDGTADTVIVAGQALPPVTTHSYTVQLVVATSATTTLTAADCTLDVGETGTGLMNAATLQFGTETTESVACAPALLGGLAINKMVDKATAAHGDTLTYTVTVTNTGQLAATNITATDVLPAGLTYAASADDGSPAVSGQTLTWQIASLPVGATRAYTVTAKIASGVTALTLVNPFGVTDPLGFPPHVTANPCAADPTQSCARTVVPAIPPIALAFTGLTNAGLIYGGLTLLGLGATLTMLALRRRGVIAPTAPPASRAITA